MSFKEITDILGIYAVGADKELYYVKDIDLSLQLGGTVNATFSCLYTDIPELSSHTGKNRVNLDSTFSVGEWVTLRIDYRENGKDSSVNLISGRIRTISDSFRTGASSVKLAAQFTLVSDLDFTDKVPLGSLMYPMSDGKWGVSRYVVEDLFSSMAKAADSANGQINVAKLAADLIEIKTTAGNVGESSNNGATYATLAPSASLKDRINVDKAPILQQTSGNIYGIGTDIAKTINKMYVSTPPLGIFMSILSSYFLICAPRTDGRVDVVENNGWKKVKSRENADIDFSLMTGLTMSYADGVYPGFDGVAVDITTKSGNRMSSPLYVVCTEALDENTGRKRLVLTETAVEITDKGAVYTENNRKYNLGRVKYACLTSWMKYLPTDKLSTTNAQGALVPNDVARSWAKWLACGIYAGANRLANRANLTMRLSGYFKLSNKIGEILSFEVPDRPGLFYGRLYRVGLHISLDNKNIQASSYAVLDCVRDEVDNKNLCIDLEIYKENINAKK
jgi:hypothetical protein